jgi:hypothetical protein
MTDFYAQLEQQLVTAAAGRARQGAVARAVSGRRTQLLAVVATVAVVVAGVAFLPGALAPSDSTPLPAPPAAPQPAGPLRSSELRGIRVAVLNATTQTGRARDYAEQLDRRGAIITFIGNDSVQGVDRADRVRYRRGAAARARRVARVLAVPRVTPLPAAQAALVPDAQVVVVVGRTR